jgi:hypothetical protein
MAYRSHHCSATLHCSVCISVFCTLLALSVLFPFMLSVPCPFNAPFPFCTFLLLRSASFFTPQSHSTTTTISSLFNILILSVHLVHAICFLLLHSLTPQYPPHRGVFSTLLFDNYPISYVPRCLSLFYISAHCECSAWSSW